MTTPPNAELSGALFENQRKDSPAHPDYTGRLTIEGREYRLAAWFNESRNGTRYLRIRATPIEATLPQPPSPPSQPRLPHTTPPRAKPKPAFQPAEPFNDDIPF